MTIRFTNLDVQLIAETTYTPPTDHTGTPIYLPTESNEGTGAELAVFSGRSCYQAWAATRPETATVDGYLKNILGQKHYSVIEHASWSFYIQGVSRALTHELARHRHFSFSQLSQRYVDSAAVQFIIPPAIENDPDSIDDLARAAETSVESYNAIVRREMGKGRTRKQSREAARAALPNATETRLVITGNYRSWMEFLIKRDNPAADAEIQRLAQTIGAIAAERAPAIFGPTARAKWDDNDAQLPATT